MLYIFSMSEQNSAGLGPNLGALGIWEDKNLACLKNFNEDEGKTCQAIVFYKLNPDGTFENGTTIEELLRVAIARLNNLNMRFSCRENSLSITKMEEALMWLNKRTEDRKSHNIEGTHRA